MRRRAPILVPPAHGQADAGWSSGGEPCTSEDVGRSGAVCRCPSVSRRALAVRGHTLPRGGIIDVAGPKDISDIGAALDWLQAHTPVDSANIGMGGISYGGGLSLLGVTLHDRVKTAVSMSGFVDVEKALFADGTPRLVWGL